MRGHLGKFALALCSPGRLKQGGELLIDACWAVRKALCHAVVTRLLGGKRDVGRYGVLAADGMFSVVTATVGTQQAKKCVLNRARAMSRLSILVVRLLVYLFPCLLAIVDCFEDAQLTRVAVSERDPKLH